MAKKVTNKVALFIAMLCIFVGSFALTAFGSNVNSNAVDENGTMISDLDAYPGLEAYLVGKLKARETGSINVEAYNIEGGVEESLDIINAILYKNPELVHVNMAKGLSVSIQSGYVKTIKIVSGYFDYNQTTFDNEVNKVMSLIDDDMSDLEKIITVHNYLCMDVEYAYDEFASGTVTDLQHSAIGAIIEKSAVCDGYAKAFSYYMDKLGITSYVVTGTATTGGNVVSHAWNQVKLDGKWYFVDVSWDDPVPDWYGNIKYTYFLKSASDFADHDWEVSDFEVCNSTKYNDSSNVFWNELKDQMFCVDGNVYYLKKIDNESVIIKHSLEDSLSEEGTRIGKVSSKWYAFGSSTSYYPGNYSRLAYANGKLYYSTATDIYEYDITAKSSAKVLNADVSKGYVYGLKANDGKLYYQTATSPNKFDGALKSCKLSELKPITADKIAITGKIKLLKSKYVYSGKYIKPGVSVAGLKKGVDFKVTYSNNKNVGTATVKVTGIGNYKGTLKKTFKIVPKKVTLSKLTTPKKKVIKATWKKVSGTGYEVLISKNKNFKSSTKYIVKGAKKLSLTISKKLVSGKRYYVKVRAYKVVKGKTYYGAYSRILNKKVK